MSVSSSEIFAVTINNIKVTTSFINSLHDIVQGQKLIEYWNK